MSDHAVVNRLGTGPIQKIGIVLKVRSMMRRVAVPDCQRFVKFHSKFIHGDERIAIYPNCSEAERKDTYVELSRFVCVYLTVNTGTLANTKDCTE